MWYEGKDLSQIKNVTRERTLIFDTETTGFNAWGEDEILQLSIVDGNGKRLYNRYFKPRYKEEWPEAAKVNQITPEFVQNEPYIEEELDRIQEIFDNADLITGYNLPFDISFISAAGIHLKEDLLRFDVMREFAPLYGVWDDAHNGWHWAKLTACAAHYGYRFQAHDSFEDAEATRHCFYELLEDPRYLDLSEKYRLKDEIKRTMENKLSRYDSVLICKKTPEIFQKIGLEDKPILMSQKHIRNCLHEKGKNPHWHGIDINVLENLPDYLSNPAMLMDSFSDDYSVIAVFDAIDNDKFPIMASIKTNGNGMYEFNAVNSNYLTSVYGRSNFENFLNRTIDADFMLYANKEKARTLSSFAGLQLLRAFPQSFRFNEILHKSVNVVNEYSDIKENRINNVNENVLIDFQNNLSKIGIDGKTVKDQTFNEITLPKGTVVNGLDLSGGKIYPLDMNIYLNNSSDNMTTVQYRLDQEIQVKLKDGEKIKVCAKELCEGVDAANNNCLPQNRTLAQSKEKNRDLEI